MFESSWQDIVLTVGNIVFLLALLPSIFSENKPSYWTSLMTGGSLTIFCFVYFSLHLPYSVLAVGVTAIAWWILFFQKITAPKVK